ncbi:Signal recognition particle subunit SRP72 [Caligus rogercresseyi]|uniref:Signal recognition particle subunit SRP72 n=1 Tax=Caligus rogercresseyi TaxID=217165 RepID=A0A7T8K118_CALRO|nr:Signal recognition particle subunit SRP72 [Caligus rogercresseyi]
MLWSPQPSLGKQKVPRVGGLPSPDMSKKESVDLVEKKKKKKLPMNYDPTWSPILSAGYPNGSVSPSVSTSSFTGHKATTMTTPPGRPLPRAHNKKLLNPPPQGINKTKGQQQGNKKKGF